MKEPLASLTTFWCAFAIEFMSDPTGEALAAAGATLTASLLPAGAIQQPMRRVSIFIKSWEPDFCWLAYCLRSLQKYARGFHEIVVAIPEQANLKLTLEKVVKVHDPDDGQGYLRQQVHKLNADRHCSGDYILHIDSDTVFREPVTPDTFFRDGKPRWFITPMDRAGKDEKKAWFHVMAKCLQRAPEYEYMRKCTVIAPRWAYAEFRAFIQVEHGMTMEAYVMNQPGREFSEYNCLGMFLHHFHPEKFYWHDESKEGIPQPMERQFWSWGGLTPKIREELEAITC